MQVNILFRLYEYCGKFDNGKLLLFQVLDELYKVLWRIRTDTNPPRAHELLQELRDISSMAMEHFDEYIANELKNKMPPMQLSLNTSLPGPSGVVFNSEFLCQYTYGV